jgi:hypothetical protein
MCRLESKKEDVGQYSLGGSSMSNEHQPPSPPTQFGVFYPLEYVVLPLQSRDDVERICQLLIDGGDDERDVALADSPQVAQGA